MSIKQDGVLLGMGLGMGLARLNIYIMRRICHFLYAPLFLKSDIVSIYKVPIIRSFLQAPIFTIFIDKQ